MWRPQYTVCVVVITGGQSSNKVEHSSVIFMLLSVYTHLTYRVSNPIQVSIESDTIDTSVPDVYDNLS